MRIAIISDVHGNVRALEAVLADVARRGTDATVNLGDCVSGPLQAAATADLLMGQAFLTVRGNHDRQLLDRAPDAMNASDRAAHEQLRPEHRAWLASLPPTATVGDVLLCHGTPTDDLTYLLETVTPHGVWLGAPVEIEHRLGDTTATIIACGHSHVPRVVRTRDGRLLVCPGSVGVQAFWDTTHYPHTIETGSPHARYALVTTGASPRVELVAVAYDWDAAAADARTARRADWAAALATGYLPRG